MAELITLTAPITKPSTTTVRIDRVVIDVEQKAITINWLGNDGLAGSASYPTPAPVGSSQPSGATLLTTLNKLNLSGANPSLVNRILTRLQSDGYIGAGATSGTPD